MKQFIAALSIIASAAYAQVNPAATDAAAVNETEVVQPSSACLYCRNQDLNAGFLVSYSFCQ